MCVCAFYFCIFKELFDGYDLVLILGIELGLGQG